MGLYDNLPEKINYWRIMEDVIDNPEYAVIFCFDERAWLDLHTLEECADPFDAFDWIVEQNIKQFMKMCG